MSGHFLRLFSPGDPGDRPGPDWTLERIFVVFLKIYGSTVSKAAVGKWHNAVRWWKDMMSDPKSPPLSIIDGNKRLIAAFDQRMQTTPFRRGKFGVEHKLKDATRRHHLRFVRRLLKFCKRRGWIRRIPKFPPCRATQEGPKEPFLIGEARAIWKACLLMTWPKARLRTKSPPRGDLPQAWAWWRAFIAISYYVGLRKADPFSLTWGHFQEAYPGRPAKLVGLIPRKTARHDKKLNRALHPDAVAAILELRPKNWNASTTILARPFDNSMLNKQHAKLCRLAGLIGRQIQSPQAWRRTHGTQIAETGFDAQMDLARQSLGHSSVQTTERHYVGGLDAAILRMSRLVEE